MIGGRKTSGGAIVKEAQNRHSRGASPAAVELRLFGTMTIHVAGSELRIVARKTRALLAYLALRAGAQTARDTLMGLLWGDRGEEQARASLRQALSELRRALGEGGAALVSGREMVALDPGVIQSDADALARAAESRDPDTLEAAARAYRGELLEGLALDEPAFDQWLSGERERFRLIATKVLAELLERAAAENRIEEAVNRALKLLALDTLQEHVHRRLIQLYMAQGRHDAALAQYEQCRRVLGEQLGVRPEAATEELARQLRTARRAPPSSASPAPVAGHEDRPSEPPPLPSRPSIAVLRFRALGSGEDNDYFAEGVAEDIITELSRNRELFVVARQSSFTFDDTTSDPGDIARTLGVRHLLTGTVRRMGARLRLSANLMDTESRSEVWADRYDRDVEDIFDVQDEIAHTVSATVFGRIAEHDVELARARRPSDLGAYDHVLRGMQHMQRYSPQDYATARTAFEKAVELDPKWARPHGYLCIIGVYQWFWEMTEDGLAHVLAAGEKALSLDGHDARSHLGLGVAHLFSRHHDRAIHHFERALALNPNDDLIACEHGRLLFYLDRPEDGLMRVREAMRLNPFHPNWYWNIYGRCLHTAGRFEEAIDAFGRVEDPQFWIAAYLAACHAMLGRTGLAQENIRHLGRDRPDFSLAIFTRALPYRNDDTLERFLDTLRKAGIR